MTNATKTLAAILVLLLVVTGLVEMMSGTEASEAFSTEILTYNPDEVDRIEIDNPNRNYSVILTRVDSTWNVRSGKNSQSYPANAASINAALDRMNNLKLKAVVSRDTADFSRFKVTDSLGSSIRFYQGDSKVGELILGSPQFISQREINTYVRPQHEDAVYSVEGLIASSIDKSVEGWRDKQIWDINRNAITQVDLLYPADSSFSIMKAEPQKWVSVGDTLDQAKIDRLLNRVSGLKATGFADSLSTDSFDSPLYTVRLHLDSGVQKAIRIKPEKGENTTSYVATATDYPYVFTLNKSTFDRSVLFGRQQLLKNEEN